MSAETCMRTLVSICLLTVGVAAPALDPRSTAGNGAEFGAVDAQGNTFAGEPRPRKLQKYARVRP